ncbi:MAG: IclR family transcriptional regulator [Chloroflexia bacterium]|nr:IclR family transcriptional regulator [Chloroflexia bacterium]
MATNGADYSIAVLNRTLDVLDLLTEAETPLGATEIARRIGTTKSAVFRILANLDRRGYVSKEAATSRYTLGVRLVVVGQRALRSLDLRHRARPVLEELHARFGETVNLAVLNQGTVVYIDMVESAHSLRTAAAVGALDPVHSTALGKAMLAFLPAAERNAQLTLPLVARTPRTLTAVLALHQELDRVRAAGIAEDNGENELGARCFGVPVFDHLGRPRAAISLSGPESRLDDGRAAEIKTALITAAGRLTAEIAGARPPAVPTGVKEEAACG